MAIQVLFFGATADAVGDRMIEMPELAGSSAEYAIKVITEKYPRLTSHKILLSINQEFASAQAVVTDGDELAIFTPVSGG